MGLFVAAWGWSWFAGVAARCTLGFSPSAQGRWLTWGSWSWSIIAFRCKYCTGIVQLVVFFSSLECRCGMLLDAAGGVAGLLGLFDGGWWFDGGWGCELPPPECRKARVLECDI